MEGVGSSSGWGVEGSSGWGVAVHSEGQWWWLGGGVVGDIWVKGFLHIGGVRVRLHLQHHWDEGHLQHGPEHIQVWCQFSGLCGGGSGDGPRDWAQLGELPRPSHHPLLQQRVPHESVRTGWLYAHTQGK